MPAENLPNSKLTQEQITRIIDEASMATPTHTAAVYRDELGNITVRGGDVNININHAVKLDARDVRAAFNALLVGTGAATYDDYLMIARRAVLAATCLQQALVEALAERALARLAGKQ